MSASQVLPAEAAHQDSTSQGRGPRGKPKSGLWRLPLCSSPGGRAPIRGRPLLQNQAAHEGARRTLRGPSRLTQLPSQQGLRTALQQCLLEAFRNQSFSPGWWWCFSAFCRQTPPVRPDTLSSTALIQSLPWLLTHRRPDCGPESPTPSLCTV